jgi:hypothetical protein
MGSSSHKYSSLATNKKTILAKRPLPLSTLATNKKPYYHTTLSSSLHSINQQKSPFSHNTLFLSSLLQWTKNTILAQHSLPLPMESLSPRGEAQDTSSSSFDEREDPSCLIKRRQSGVPFGSAWHILWWFRVCGTSWNPISGASETSHPSQVSKRF